jgi:hypothetical protein
MGNLILALYYYGAGILSLFFSVRYITIAPTASLFGSIVGGVLVVLGIKHLLKYHLRRDNNVKDNQR